MPKTILITGSTDGIGKLSAEKLATAGHELLLHGRNPQKLESVVQEIKEKTQNRQISGFLADFSDLSQVKSVAQKILEDGSKIDILINNAGVFKTVNPHPKGQIDQRFVVNYFAPYLLTEALLPLITTSKDGRIINLSSAAQASVSLSALKGEASLSDFEVYSQSKLALTMWSFFLAKKYPKLTITAVNPGSLLDTPMVQEAFGHSQKPVSVGAEVLYRLALEESLSGVTGAYFDNDQGDFGSAHPDAYDEQKIAAVVASTVDILKAFNY